MLENNINKNSRNELLIIKNAQVVTMDPLKHIISNGVIVVDPPRITAVLDEHEYEKNRERWEILPHRVINAGGMVALPGFINTHTHVNEILLRGGVASDRSLYEWQWNITYPGLRLYTQRDCHISSLLYCLDAMRFGTTTFVDNSNLSFDPDLILSALVAYESSGMRVIVAPVISGGTLPDSNILEMIRVVQNNEKHVAVKDTFLNLEDIFHMLESLMAKYNHNPNSRIHIWPAPHKPNRTSVESIQRSYELANKYNCMVSQPVAEVAAESKVVGLSSVEFLYYQNLISDRSLLGHCVHISNRDIRFIKEKSAKVAHLPIANLYLGSGVAPIPAMLANNITVGLGTDNANCNDTVNLFREMLLASLIHKGVTEDAGIINAEQVLEMVTIGAAKAIGRDDEIGSLELGKRADLILIDINKSWLTPIHNIVAGLIYQANGSEVNTVIVDGKILVENRKILFMSEDEEKELCQVVQHRSREILRQLGYITL